MDKTLELQATSRTRRLLNLKVRRKVLAIRQSWSDQERQARKEEGNRRRLELAAILGFDFATSGVFAKESA